tara:strand:+ start:1807 stop:2001 length:195 start_codon:yes stop_codon:yes gene_type:complete
MNTLWELLGLLAAGLLVWLIWRAVRSNPDNFNKESMSKSFFTIGILALILICFIGLLILMAQTM